MHAATALADIARAQHGLFTLTQLIEVGYTRSELERRLRTGEWGRWSGGLYGMTAFPKTFEQRCHAATLATSGSFISHEAAGRLRQLPKLDPATRELVVLSVRHGQHSPFEWVRLYHSSQMWHETVSLVDGIPTATVERTLVDLANVVSPGRMALILDTTLELGRVDLESLMTTHRRLARRGRNGSGRIRPLLEERGIGVVCSGTKLEKQFRSFLRRHGLPEPEEQVLLHRDELPIGIVDFHWAANRIVIEVDGRLGHLQRSGFERDRRRDQEAAALGLLPLRVTWNQLTREAGQLAERLKEVFRRRHPPTAGLRTPEI